MRPSLSTVCWTRSEATWRKGPRPMSENSDLVQQRYQKLDELKNLGFDPYPHKFEWSHTIPDLVERFAAASGEELEANPVSVRVAGRIVALRPHGKAGFGHMSGGGARVQIYARQDRLREEGDG